MKYASALDHIPDGIFNRQDLLDSLLNLDPDYNTGSFNRHFSKLLSAGFFDCIGKNLYVKINQNNTKNIYTYDTPSEELITAEALIASEFPLVDFIILETVSLNEFLNHLIANNAIIIMVEKMLTDSIFYFLKSHFSSVLITPSADDMMRYGQNGSIIIDRLCYRYPKNPKQKYRSSIEKLIVDLFAEKLLNIIISKGDYPAALEIMFKRYKINETRLFNYARDRCVEDEIRVMIKEKTNITLYTDMR